MGRSRAIARSSADFRIGITWVNQANIESSFQLVLDCSKYSLVACWLVAQMRCSPIREDDKDANHLFMVLRRLQQ